MDRVSVEESIELVESRGKILDGSRICRGYYWEKKKESSIEMSLSRICREAIELEEKEFFILFLFYLKGKTQGGKCNKQATQPKIQLVC